MPSTKLKGKELEVLAAMFVWYCLQDFPTTKNKVYSEFGITRQALDDHLKKYVGKDYLEKFAEYKDFPSIKSQLHILQATLEGLESVFQHEVDIDSVNSD